MRTGTAIALLFLVAGAIFFAPRLGRKQGPDLPSPTPSRPERKAAVPLYDLRPLLALVPDDEIVQTYPDEAWRKLDAMRKNRRKHATAEEYERVAGWLTATREHTRRLRENQRYREEWQVRTNFRMDPFLREYRFVVASRPPWLVFVQEGGGAAVEAERSARLLVALTDEIHRLIGRPLDLPRILDLPHPSQRLLTYVIFQDRRVFREHIRRTGRHLRALDVSWYLSRGEGCLTSRNPSLTGEQWRSQLYLPASFLALDVLGDDLRWTTDPDHTAAPWGPHPVRRNGMLWLAQGLAAALSSERPAGNGRMESFRLRREYLEVLRKGDAWLSLREFLMIRSWEDLQSRARSADLGIRVRRVDREFHARSWALVHFLWLHGEGKYRERLLSYLREELRGRGGYYLWAKIWAPISLDWSRLEKEFEAWLDETCEREGVK